MSDKVAPIIEACAKIADDAADKITVMLKSDVRKSPRDRVSRKQLLEAKRWCETIAANIRALSPEKAAKKAESLDSEARAALKELRPLIASTTKSHWRTGMLARIDKILR